MYSITVRNNILIAHTLPGEVFGPAQNMHGATYIVDAEFFAKELNEFNIIMDLGVVTEILADVLKFYSYKNLDLVDPFEFEDKNSTYTFFDYKTYKFGKNEGIRIDFFLLSITTYLPFISSFAYVGFPSKYGFLLSSLALKY